MAVLATDDFAGTGALSANWTANDNNSTTMSRSSGQAISDTASSDAAYRYSGIAWPNNQYSTSTLGPTSADGVGTGYGVTVRCDTSGTLTTGQTFYRLVGNASGYELTKFVNAAVTTLESSSGTTFTNGDTIRLEISGSQPTMKKNNVSFGSPPSDSGIASGAAGIGHSSTTTSGDGIASWEGGDIDPVPQVIAWITA